MRHGRGHYAGMPGIHCVIPGFVHVEWGIFGMTG